MRNILCPIDISEKGARLGQLMVSARIFERKVFITNDTRNMKTILKNEFILIFTVRFRYPSIWL